MSFSFYIMKSYTDYEPGIELVNIHYTTTPIGQIPDWNAQRETRAMPRGGVVIRGQGGTTLDESGTYTHTHAETVHLPDDGVRRKVIRLPNAIWEPHSGWMAEHYMLHHYFEAFRHGQRETSPLYSEEIVTKEIEYIDHQGNLGGMCIFWSIYDWGVAQYTPTEDPNFISWYGEDTPFRSHKFYGAEDKDGFQRIRGDMIRALPTPRRWLGKIRAPRGARVYQKWHVGSLWQPNPADRWEDYWGDFVHVL
jgi:hypothetical protein